ncbi:MAG TPA: response regulator [Verrucomicrobiae bacterium]|nr:response regulator [Verrucomicrobiae bacterium]
MKKVLIIEDDPIVAHIYKTRLERESYEVEVATDGQDGVKQMNECSPDAVMLDLMLPRMNGVDVLKKIRSRSEFQNTPVIVFTNAYVPTMINEAYQAGATQVFNKATLTPRQIIDALHTAIYSDNPDFTNSGAAPMPDGSNQPGSSNNASTSAPQGEGEQSNRHAGSGEQQASRETEYQSEMVKTFNDSAPEILLGLRKMMSEFSKTSDEAGKIEQLLNLYRKVHGLTGSAGLAGLHNISLLSSALEVLLKELYDKPKNVNASTLRTVASSIDFIFELFQKAPRANLLERKPVEILVVDDEILSRRAVSYALEKAGLKAASVEDPQTALNQAAEKQYDLIFLDVQMPGLDGFELCTKIRAVPLNKTTPVIFVTNLNDLKSRARSSLSGGNDFIAKPFMFIELSVKALTYVMRNRLAAGPGIAEQSRPKLAAA